MVRSKIVAGVAALAISAGTLTMLSPRSGEAQGNAKETLVRVVNTPLPVSGDVNAAVTGNVNATISGNVSLQPGTIVNIGNSEAAPVLIRDVGAAKQPASGFQGCFFSALGLCTIDIATVPLGYRLVIEQMSGSIHLFDPDRVAEVVVGRAFQTCCISTNAGYLNPRILDGTAWYSVNDPTLMYFDSGETVRIFITKGVGATSGTGVANFSYAGHLIAN